MPITAYEAESQVRTSSDLFDAMVEAKDNQRQPDRFAVDCGRVDAEHVQTHLVPLALTFCGSEYALAEACDFPKESATLSSLSSKGLEADWKGNVVLRFKRVV